MNKYKPGDKVIFIKHDDSDLEQMTIGKLYVIKVYDSLPFPIQIEKDDSEHLDVFNDNQFRLATPDEIAFHNFPKELERLLDE